MADESRESSVAKKKENKKLKTKEKKKRVIAEENERKEKALSFSSIDVSDISTFSDIPLSGRTLKGLLDSGFTKPTEIQKEGIILALRNHDVLGAAKTGSGKTLAFIVPLLELLWHEKWSDVDGLGALVISPTRELALQIYDVLRKVGKEHDFSAGLVIGGKDLKDEQQKISNTNIVIGTPGRILQHFDETPSFSCLNLKLLVLDEADRILDLGFSNTMNAIIENVPEDRQTLLYSATQTKSVKDLARLSLHNPEYIAVHESAKYITPKKLIQNYIILDLEGKIDFLYSFVKNHLRAKCIVFLSSCKQVKFIYEVFRKLRPGIPLTALYGKQKQLKRVAIYNRFCSIQSAVLFATDIAARGLDFPAVNWVIQYDCPENPDTYIHRVGRTARYEKGGQALLMLLPSEENMVPKLVGKKVPIHELKCNPKKVKTIQGKLQAFCIQDQQIKDWAQKSIISYVRSVYLQADKSIFDVTKLPLDKFSNSCGLMAMPKLNFMKKIKRIGPLEGKKDPFVIATKEFPAELHNFVSSDKDDDDDDDVLVKKSGVSHHENMDVSPKAIEGEKNKHKRKPISKPKIAKKLINKNINVSSRIVFNEDGVAEQGECDNDNGKLDTSDGIDIEKAKLYIKEQDKIDYENEKLRIKQKHKESKDKEKQKRKIDIPMHELCPTLGEDGSSDEMDVSDEDFDFPSKRQKLMEGNIADEDENIVKISSTLEEDEGLALHLLGVG